MICAACGVVADSGRCANCGKSPLLGGRYRFDTLVGNSGVGRTYRAQRLEGGDIVAVKQLRLRGLDEETEAAIDREAAALGALTHPRVPKNLEHLILGEGEYRSLYIVQDFVEGESLADEMRRRTHDEDEVLGIAEALLPVLQYLHGKTPRVCHLDIKPANVLRATDGSLFLMDFGSVRELVTGSRTGRPVARSYAAPEQLEGISRQESDLYAIGALMIALLSRSDPPTLLLPPSAPRWQANLRVRPTTRHVLLRLLERDPDRRMHSASEARAAIRAAKRGSYLLTREEASTRRRQDKLTSRILIVMFVVMVFGMAYGVVIEDARRHEALVSAAVEPVNDRSAEPIGAARLAQAMARASDPIRSCYLKALEGSAGLRALPIRAELRLRVDDQGAPTDVGVHGPPALIAAPALRQCIADAIRAVRFTGVRVGAIIRLPLDLVPPS